MLLLRIEWVPAAAGQYTVKFILPGSGPARNTNIPFSSALAACTPRFFSARPRPTGMARRPCWTLPPLSLFALSCKPADHPPKQPQPCQSCLIPQPYRSLHPGAWCWDQNFQNQSPRKSPKSIPPPGNPPPIPPLPWESEPVWVEVRRVTTIKSPSASSSLSTKI